MVPAAVPAVGPLGAHHALSRIVLILSSIVGVVVGAADVVDGDVVRSSDNGGSDRPHQAGHRISNLSYKTPEVIEAVVGSVGRDDVRKSGDGGGPINVSSLSSSLRLIIIILIFFMVIIICFFLFFLSSFLKYFF